MLGSDKDGNKIQWVLDVEVNIYYDKSKLCKKYLIEKWKKENIIARTTIIDKDNKEYILNFFVINGQIFSIESNLPFKKLLVSNILSLKIECIKNN